MPVTACAISPSTFCTARVTPLPDQRSPPSRSSVASNSPVDAPEGTAARPFAPELSCTSTSTVGLPRLSRIWRARTRAMLLTARLRGAGRSAGCSARFALGSFEALAVHHRVSRAAFGHARPLLFEFFDELRECRLLSGGAELLFDGRFGR